MEKFANLPQPLKWILGVTGAGGLMATGSAVAMGKWMFILILAILLVLLVGGYLLWNAWRRKKQNAQLGREIEQHTSASPRGISDPAQRARLDDLRKKFEAGVKEYRSRGKDLYKLPWYVIVGEPGSGKTEAVRHSNVGFPPGMQDEFQGVGGTINMNWWFTNHAVLLDTAGRLMFEEVKPGETSEWREFLNLLKKNRPNCPINGLFLVIPTDSLILNTADEIAKKAGKIAQQLDVIQRVLDVRFPVFVVVTKCDKVNGFREFFDGMTDPQLQHQMMGWSNPDPLDAPFRAELVEQHLNTVVQRLRRRRLGLLRDPVAENPNGRRTDEVDSLYPLPHNLSLIGSRLRRYLETIFIAGEWSAKPLFLRGIYFSSSMREGAALDQELADVLGVSADALPEGKVWERERSYFLRDLFLEKVFREKGLVTRAGNTSRMLRARQLGLFGCGFAALAIFIVVAYFGTKDLNEKVQTQSNAWGAATNWWEDKTWKHSLIRRDEKGVYSGYTTDIEVAGKSIPLGQFHVRLRELAEKGIKRNWMFPNLADTYNNESKRAQRIVFEGGVIKPLVEATRQKMLRREVPADPASQRRQVDALVSLIQLEADLVARQLGTNPGTLDASSAEKFMKPLLAYATAQDLPADTNLVATMAWTYTTNEKGRGAWPPGWLAGTTNLTNNLANNLALQAGLDSFIRTATNLVQSQIGSWGQVMELLNALKSFQDNENNLFKAAQAADANAVKRYYDELGKARKAVDDLLGKAANSSLFASGVSLTNAYRIFTTSVVSSAAGALEGVKAANGRALRLTNSYPLFVDIQNRLKETESLLASRVTRLVSAGDQTELKSFDELFLAKQADESLAYAKRWAFYQQVAALPDKKWINKETLIGSKADALDTFLRTEVGKLRSDVSNYAGQCKAQLTGTCNYFLDRAEKFHGDAYLASYLEEAGKRLGEYGRFPLTGTLSANVLNFADLKTASDAIKLISGDLGALGARSVLVRDRLPQWGALTNQVAKLAGMTRAILGDADIPLACTLSLRKWEDPRTSREQWRHNGVWRTLRLSVEGDAREEKDTLNDKVDEILGNVSVQQKFDIQLPKADKVTERKTETWGPLWLICKYKGAPEQKSDRSTWVVDWPMENPTSPEWTIRLKLKFDRPLPDNWPSP